MKKSEKKIKISMDTRGFGAIDPRDILRHPNFKKDLEKSKRSNLYRFNKNLLW